MHQCMKFTLFWNDTLHVSESLSVFRQEFETAHTATRYCCLHLHLVGFTIELIAITDLCKLFDYTPFDDSEYCIDIVIRIWTC